MKKAILILLMFSSMQFTLNAQKLYFKGQIGYDFGFMKSQSNFVSSDYVTTSDTTIVSNSYQSYRNSFATGAALSAGLGIMITKDIGLELTGFYTACMQRKFASEIHMQDIGGYRFNAYSDYSVMGTSFGVKQAVRYTFPGKELRPFIRFGAMLDFASANETMKMDVSTDNPYYYPYGGMEYTLQYKQRLSVGMNLAIGLEYLILEKLWLYAELEGNMVNYFPAAATYTRYITNRQDITAHLSTHDKEIIFVDQYSDAGNKSASEPRKMLPVHFSFSSIGFNVGLKYTLFD